jgi:hypothetical protein
MIHIYCGKCKKYMPQPQGEAGEAWRLAADVIYTCPKCDPDSTWAKIMLRNYIPPVKKLIRRKDGLVVL